jgi:putative hemolysin
MSQLNIQRYLDQAKPDQFRPAWLSNKKELYFPFAKSSSYRVDLACNIEELREAQRLRFNVFHDEFGAVFSTREQGMDIDTFDEYCDHLIVRHVSSGCVVGTYRLLLPMQAKRIGRYYSQSEFYMIRIERQISGLVELGRSCVHADHRNGPVINLLWAAIARYMRHYQCTHLIGCASVSMRDGGATAAALWEQFQCGALIDPVLEAFPRHPLPVDQIECAQSVQVPPLIRGYLKLGAQICAAPNWDPDFNTADFLMLLDLSKMNPRYARHFGFR